MLLEGSAAACARPAGRCNGPWLVNETECSSLRIGMPSGWSSPMFQDDGRLVLLDWGQCKALTAARQRALAHLVVALDRGWTLGIVAAMSGMGLSFLAKVGLLSLPYTCQ